MRNQLLIFVSILALGCLATAPLSASYFSYAYMSGETLYATASTDSDGDDTYASTDLVIYGPTANSPYVWECVWYYTSVNTSLSLLSQGAGTGSVYSLHSIGFVPFPVNLPVTVSEFHTTYSNPTVLSIFGSQNEFAVASYTKYCPFGGGTCGGPTAGITTSNPPPNIERLTFFNVSIAGVVDVECQWTLIAIPVGSADCN